MSLESAPARRPLLGGAAMAAGSRVAVAITGALATILVARLLGPEGSGGYAVALTLLQVLTVFTTLGFEHGIVYYVSGQRVSARAATRRALLVSVATGLAGAAAGVLARLLVPAAFGGLTVAETAAVACALPFALAWLYLSYVALALDRYETFAIPPAAQSTVALALVVALGVPFGLAGAVAGVALSHVAAAAIALIDARRWLGARGGPRDEPGWARGAFAFGARGYVASMLQTLNHRVGLFMLAAAASASAAGQYAVALSVTMVMWLLPLALSDVLYPRIAALSASVDEQHARGFVETKTLRHTSFVTAATALVLAAALVLLVVPIYGPKFRPAVELGLILLPGASLYAIASTLQATIVGYGRPGYAVLIGAISTPLTIALYAVLIPAWAATGAAVATSASYAVTFLLAAICYRRVTGAAAWPRLLPTRAELRDYRTVPPAFVTWVRGRAAAGTRRGA